MKRSAERQSPNVAIPDGMVVIDRNMNMQRQGPVAESCIVPPKPGVLAITGDDTPKTVPTRSTPEYHPVQVQQPIPIKPRPKPCECCPPPRPLPPCPTPTPEPCVVTTAFKDIDIVGVNDIIVNRIDDFLTRTYEIGVDLDKIVDKQYVDNAVAPKADKTYVDNALLGKSDKDLDATQHNVAWFDEHGNPVDSGFSIVEDADAPNFSDNLPTGGAVSELVETAISNLDATVEGQGTNVAVEVVENDGLITDVHITVDNTENVGNKVSSIRDAGIATDTAYPSEAAVRTELDTKANKVIIDPGVDPNGNLPSLDQNGNLIDSGILAKNVVTNVLIDGETSLVEDHVATIPKATNYTPSNPATGTEGSTSLWGVVKLSTIIL